MIALPSIDTVTPPKHWAEPPAVEQFIEDYNLPDVAARLLVSPFGEHVTERNMADMVECLRAVIDAITEHGWPLRGQFKSNV